jgi:protein AroM
MAQPPRIAFVTIGQTPRVDLMPEVLELIGREVEAVERGALDGMTSEEVERMAPGPRDKALVTRMRDGAEAVVSKARMEGRLNRLLEELDDEPLDAVVLLCTGRFPGLEPGRHPLVEAQEVVDAAITHMAVDGRAVGIVVPLERQEAEFHGLESGVRTVFAHADPYAHASFAEAAERLAGCGSRVLHCIGYDRAMQSRLATLTGGPVLLSRALVAGAVRDLIDERSAQRSA